jgi:hypothetical protein
MDAVIAGSQRGNEKPEREDENDDEKPRKGQGPLS